jgi:FKBP-type peptidyl-prolyl cis-trans isomerase 2
MQTGDFVYVNYVGKVKDTNEIFDTTDAEVAKKEKIYDEKVRYKPVPIIVDGGFVIVGLNEAVKSMTVGEKKTLEITADKAFGNRNPELIKLIPEARFKDQNIDAAPGAYVTINKLRGRIVSIDGGRVRVDFNHPLAGKVLVYDLEIVRQATKNEEKVKALCYYFVGCDEDDVSIAEDKATLDVKFKNKFDMPIEVKGSLAQNAMKWLAGIEKIRFIDEFDKGGSKNENNSKINSLK